MKLLVAEDEPKTGTYLQQGLSEAGFTVDRVENGTDAAQHALHTTYDLLILDVMMPGLDGRFYRKSALLVMRFPCSFSPPETGFRIE